MDAYARTTVLAVVSLLLSVGFVAAQADGEAGDASPEAPELREAVQRLFHQRLRTELSLSDEQMARIVPRLGELEFMRRDLVEERRQLLRRLHQGLQSGANDTQLAALLERLDAVEATQHEQERAIRDAINETLSVRQRVQFRFFLERFRRDLSRRVRDLRDRGGRGGGPPTRRQSPRRGP